MINDIFFISSFIKKPGTKIADLKDKGLSDKFINIDNFEQLLSLKKKLDPDYVEGYIFITYKGQVILDAAYWDLVDQLWAYILSMILEVMQNKYAKTCFPDQPLEINFELVDSNIIFTIGEYHSFVLPKDIFFENLIYHAQKFFEFYIKLFGNRSFISIQLKKIEIIKNRLQAK